MFSIAPGETIIDQFPVFNDDGYTTKTGLLAGDFTVSVYVDGASTSLTVTITEIGSTGNYRMSYSPPTEGYWNVQVLADFNKDIWVSEAIAQALGGSIESKLDYIANQVDKIDLKPTLAPAAVTNGSLMDRTMNKDSAKTYNQGTDSLEAIRDRSG